MSRTQGGMCDIECRLDIANDVRDLRRMSEWLCSLLREAELTSSQIYDFELCANEAISNIIQHAVGAPPLAPIRLTLWIADRQISLSIEDKSAAFDPIAARLPDPAATLDEAVPGGLGLVLIHRLLPASTYERTTDGNVLVLRSQL